jgi:hypothetical protein
MRVVKQVMVACSIALAGFGIMLIGISSIARGFPVTLFFTSVTLYLSEAVLFWGFFLGLWWFCGWAVARVLHRGPVVWLSMSDDPAQVADLLRRFAFLQVFFVAVWSIVFKGVLYTTLSPAYGTYLMSKTQSLGIAIPAECIILVLCCVGLAAAFVRVRSGRRVVSIWTRVVERETADAIDVTP